MIGMIYECFYTHLRVLLHSDGSDGVRSGVHGLDLSVYISLAL